MTLFQKGQFILRSGRESVFKIECDALSDGDWYGLAAMADAILRARGVEFGSTRGVPRGGVPLAMAMHDYVTHGSPVVLICEDVWTTGGSVRRFIEKHYSDRPTEVLCAFARGPGCTHAIIPLPEELHGS